MNHNNLQSLSSKITRSYYTLAVVLLLLGAVSISDLLFLEEQIKQNETIAAFEESILEMRREEKNFFLYGAPKAQSRAIEHSNKAQQLLDRNLHLFTEIMPPDSLKILNETLSRYIEMIDQWSEKSSKQARTDGHTITVLAEQNRAHEQQILKISTDKALYFLVTTLLLLSFIIIFVGRKLRRIAINPLKQLELSLEPLAQGELSKLSPPSEDREFVLLTDRFNQTLHELELRRKRMQQSEKLVSLGNLAAGVAHELNNPLSNIYTSTQLLQEELSALTEQEKRWLQQIIDETERGRKIIRTLLEYGSKHPFNKTPYLLSEIVDETLSIIGKTITQSNTTLSVNIPEDLVIHADKPRLQQVLINLIENALKANSSQLQLSATWCERGIEMIPEGAKLVGAPSCSKRVAEEAIEILLTDDGHGISDEQIPHIFDPFYTNSQPGEGTGLGLYIVHEIIHDHDGCIAVESTPKQGTQIILLLPTETKP